MKSLMVLLLLCVSFSIQADDSEAEKLFQGCNELVGIYENYGEKRLFASLVVSSSDAMLAGYCMGVTKFLTGFGKRDCGGRSWLELAEVIAKQWKVRTQLVSVDKALSRICRG
jgi:hypothetical protein